MAAAGAKRLTAGALSRMAAEIYPEGSVLFRALQKYRPYICPFEALIEEVPEGASVLDIGCGGGLFLGLVDAAGLRPEGTGFDVSRPAIDPIPLTSEPAKIGRSAAVPTRLVVAVSANRS